MSSRSNANGVFLLQPILLYEELSGSAHTPYLRHKFMQKLHGRAKMYAGCIPCVSANSKFYDNCKDSINLRTVLQKWVTEACLLFRGCGHCKQAHGFHSEIRHIWLQSVTKVVRYGLEQINMNQSCYCWVNDQDCTPWSADENQKLTFNCFLGDKETYSEQF